MTTLDDDDFVVLSSSSLETPMKTSPSEERAREHRRVPSSVSSSSSVDSLVPDMKSLSIDLKSNSPAFTNPTKGRRKGRRANSNPETNPPSPKKKVSEKPPKRGVEKPAGTKVTPKPSVASKAHPQQIAESLGLGERPIVDDVSEYSVESSFYENAVQLMGSVLASHGKSPEPYSRLSILQALIIELGLVDSEIALPTTLTSAKALLRSNVFVNIRDYVATREQGPEALQQIMHKSRGSLIRDLRKKKKHRAPLAWVKDSGLSVLLVSCY